MNTTKSIIVVAILTLLSIRSQSQTLNFSGTWRLNKTKSDFGNMSQNSAPIQIKIIQDKYQFSVERKQLYASGDSTVYIEKMNLDGKPSETAVKEGLKKTTMLKWSEDGLALLDESVYSNAQKAKGKWSLSKDKKTLTLNRESANGENTDKVTYVYEKN